MSKTKKPKVSKIEDWKVHFGKQSLSRRIEKGTDMSKFVVLVFFVLILFNLFSGLYYLLKDKSDSKRMVTALKWRVALSLMLVAFLAVGAFMGWITPHGLV